MKNIYWLVICILVIALAAFYLLYVRENKNSFVIINDKKISVEVAKTPAEREKGLSGRESLATDSGMLFAFSSSSIHAFWMKDTLIPLDIIWINNSKIVDIQTLDAESEDFTPEYTPTEKANYVLEINAGEAQHNNFKIGDSVQISTN